MSSKNIKLSQACEGMIRYKQAAGKSDGTILHPHRFRHTFAINYLRNGGDVFTLKELLGHSDLEMTEHHARIAQIDTENDHRKAGPVDNWRL